MGGLKIPGDEQENVIGSLEMWNIKRNGKIENSTFERVWRKVYKNQANSVIWWEENSIIALGCNDGFLIILKELRSEKLKYEELVETKIHGKQINGLAFLKKNSILYSISKDRKLKTFDLELRLLESGKKKLIFFRKADFGLWPN